MDCYPDTFVTHNLPLVVVSGLEASDEHTLDPSGKAHNFLLQGGFRVRTDAAPVSGEISKHLLQAFRDLDGSSVPWHAQALASRSSKPCKISYTGRVYTLPPRKAPPPPHSPRFSPAAVNGSPPPPLTLHSPISPLTPSSPLYPDGIMSPLWLMKHQTRLPCLFIVFLALTADPKTSSLQDNRLKSEIGNIRTALNVANYKTKLLVVIVGCDSVASTELDDRFSNLKRSSGLDSKSFLFLPHGASATEVLNFVRSTLSSLHPACLEYYRDLSKHVRRKRNRNIVPQPTVMPLNSSILPLAGWTVRYEFKLGVLAEFRQEMDAACRNYEAAYEALFSSEVIDAASGGSLRFKEARLLADVIAFRTIRCLLWNDQITIAVRSWSAHRERVKDLLQRRGNGIEGYTWQAWQSTWTKAMADLISKCRVPILHSINRTDGNHLPVFARLENSLAPGERISPWEQLHHQGYWLHLSSIATVARRSYALQSSEKIETHSTSQAGLGSSSELDVQNARLALGPYSELQLPGRANHTYGHEIVATLDSAIEHFTERGQLRKSDLLKFEQAIEYVEMRSWAKAIQILQSLWETQSWREAGWWQLLQRVAWIILDCLANSRNLELEIRVLWESANCLFESRPGSGDDLILALNNASTGSVPTSVSIDVDGSLSPLIPSFAFSTNNGFVGEPLECQVTIQNRSRQTSLPLHLDRVEVAFEGNLRTIHLVSHDSKDAPVSGSSVDFIPTFLHEAASATMVGSESTSTMNHSETRFANLSIPSGATHIFQFPIIPREAGAIAVASITLLIHHGNLKLTARSCEFEHSTVCWWETRNRTPVPRLLGCEPNTNNTVMVLPKLPKLQIHALNLRKAYYTNERFVIDFEIVNEEVEAVTGGVQVQMISPVSNAAQLGWAHTESTHTQKEMSASGTVVLEPQSLGVLEAAARQTVSIRLRDTSMAIDHEIELIVRYQLASEPEINLTKTLAIDIPIIRPFEANYEFQPRLSDEPWPRFFSTPLLEADASTPLGLKHQYAVTASLYSFASESLVIEGILLTAKDIVGGAVCASETGVVKKGTEGAQQGGADAIRTIINPEQTERFDFELLIQKLVLGDRHTVGVDLLLEIGWRRQDSEEVHATVLEVPRLVAAMAEPRVILRTFPVSLESESAHRLEFMVENPSMHFLTFNLAMEASEEFAFSGPKTTALSLVPMSRSVVVYKILPSRAGEWIAVNMNVVDAYFGQTLNVLPGDDGVRVNKKGGVLIKV
ncbi:hypothetical protein PV10_07949 [Exophiala mesophila]|uniref:Trafficking protein particle complex subunit 11 domain-containing protein n=1 Tax=Exophiala mesophila TaxID=212818 RepID=A0A0D1WHF2_EXOME|nr:uncharacterized protein PV10_07949 [Exophiala mesophila]KIV88250.1 hypothetical protein PV10_07949 [Exophiala mesophila]